MTEHDLESIESTEDMCGKFRAIIGLRKNFELYSWNKYKIGEPFSLEIPPSSSFHAQMLTKYEGI